MRILLALGVLCALAGCRGETSTSPPILPLRNMFDQQRYDPQAQSAFFEDGRTMRTPPAHTFAREMEVDPEVGEGRLADGSGYVMTIPDRAVQELGGVESALGRGQDRYNIYCTPCHDGTGNGNGEAIKRGMMRPPSLHEARFKKVPDGQLFATVSNGVRNMPAYGSTIPVRDRWAIVSYVRALQLTGLQPLPEQPAAAQAPAAADAPEGTQ